MISLKKNWAPALLILLIAITKILAIIFLIGVLMGDANSSFNLTQRLDVGTATGLGVGFALLSIAGWAALWYFGKKNQKENTGPFEKIEHIGK